MTALRLALLAALAGAQGCARLSNRFDAVRDACGEDVDASARLIHVEGTALEAVFVAAAGAGPEISRPLAISSRGCVAAPAGGTGLVLVRDNASDRGAGFALGSGEPFAIEPAQPLDAAPAALSRETLTIACGGATAVAHAIGYIVTSAPAARLGHPLVALRLGDSLSSVAAIAGLGSVELPSTLPEGPYELDIDSADAFDAAKGVAPAAIRCPFVLDRTAPVVSFAAAAVDAAPGPMRVAPGAALSLTAADQAATTIHYCLTAQKEGEPPVPCQAEFARADGPVYAPSAGLWTLAYYGVDAAGNASPVRTASFAVYHSDQILRLQAEIQTVRTQLQARQLFEAYPTLFEALWTYEQLPLALERADVQDQLDELLLAVAPRVNEIQRFAARSAAIRTLAASIDAQAVAAWAEGGDLDLLGSDGTRKASWPAVAQAQFLGGGHALALLRLNGQLSLVDDARETALASSVDEIQTSADGTTLVARSGAGLSVFDAAGAPSANTTIPGAGGTLAAVSPDGSALAVLSPAGVHFWSRAAGQWAGPLSLDTQRCTVRSAVIAGGPAVILGTNDADPSLPPGPGIDLTHFGTPCGLRRWTPATNASDLLTYTDAAGRSMTPNDASFVGLSLDGQRLFAASEDESLLFHWSSLPVALGAGAWNEIGQPHVGALAFALDRNDLAAVSNTAGDVRVYDQRRPGAPLDYLARLDALDAPAQAMAFLPGAGTLVTGDRDGKVRFFVLASQEFPSYPQGSAARPTLAGGSLLAKAPLAPQGIAGTTDRLVVIDDGDQPVLAREARDGTVKARFAGMKGAPAMALVLGDAGLVVGRGQDDAALTVWTLDGARKLAIGDADLRIDDASFAADGKTAMTLDRTHHRLTLWRFGSIEELARGLCSELALYRRTHSSGHADAVCRTVAAGR